MKIWIDAQLPPTLANWLSATFGLEASALRDLSLRDAQDINIFEAARAENAVIMTCLLYTSPSPRDGLLSRMPSSA